MSTRRLRTRPLRIGCASAFRGDPEAGAAQRVRSGGIGFRAAGVASLRHDPQGKDFAQMLLDPEVEVPRALVEDRS